MEERSQFNRENQKWRAKPGLERKPVKGSEPGSTRNPVEMSVVKEKTRVKEREMSKRVFEGIANHVWGYEGDYLNVIEGEVSSISISDLLPPELRLSNICSGANYGGKCFRDKDDLSTKDCPYRDKDWICRPPRFRFKITIETEKL